MIGGGTISRKCAACGTVQTVVFGKPFTHCEACMDFKKHVANQGRIDKDKEKLANRALEENGIISPEDAMTRAIDTQVGGDHYKNLPIQPVIFCQRNKLSACESSVVKYVCRHRSKNGRKDLEKAIHYLQILIEEEYSEK